MRAVHAIEPDTQSNVIVIAGSAIVWDGQKLGATDLLRWFHHGLAAQHCQCTVHKPQSDCTYMLHQNSHSDTHTPCRNNHQSWVPSYLRPGASTSKIAKYLPTRPIGFSATISHEVIILTSTT